MSVNPIIIAIITTKNRTNLFKKTINSVKTQILQPEIVIVVSDSTNQNCKIEKSYIKNYESCLYLKNKHSRNYAGSLNTAIDYVTKEKIVNENMDSRKMYIAILDDDDTWDKQYIYECAIKLKHNPEIITSGLIYKNEKVSKKLRIYKKIDMNIFLHTNPNIQGSNTFIQLKTLLLAGGFDENLNSTTDRDFFTRVFMLQPSYSVINKYLVNIDSSNNRNRLTNNKKRKLESLIKFYGKYNSLMDTKTKELFFKRTHLFNCNLNEESITRVFNKKQINSKNTNFITPQFSGLLVIGMIVTQANLGLRLIKQIVEQKINKKIVIFINFEKNVSKFKTNISNLDIDCIVYDLENICSDFKNHLYFQKSCTNEIFNKQIKDIAVARMILHHYLKINSKDGDTIWILDDDMELKTLIREDNNFIVKEINLSNILSFYYKKADVVIGSYALDPPLPVLSILRTSLIDYVYKVHLLKKDFYDYSILDFPDYYYDTSDFREQKHLETPFSFSSHISLEQIFSGKALSRPLFMKEVNTFEPRGVGGNMIIYNRQVLDVYNISLKIDNLFARRGDYFWIQQLIKNNFTVIGSSYCTLHNRQQVSFNYNKEIDKKIKDLIGSSFTKTYKNGNKDSIQNANLFIEILKNKTTSFVISYYRIMGLLKIMNDKIYKCFNQKNLELFLTRMRQYFNFILIKASLDMQDEILRFQNYKKIIPYFKKELENKFRKKVEYINLGNEGCIFSSDNKIYKIFFHDFNIDILKKASQIFENNKSLRKLNFGCINKHILIYYQKQKFVKEYNYENNLDWIDFVLFLKNNNFVVTNIKKANFLTSERGMEYIDYGKNIEAITKRKFEKSIERIYQMIKYKLSDYKFKQMVNLAYYDPNHNLNYGIENFKNLLAKRNKEEIHDKIIIEKIRSLKAKKILDYGAGKCKIANILCDKYDVSVFDVDVDTITSKANKGVQVIQDINNIKAKYDLIISNYVLCCVDNSTCENIVQNIYQHTSSKGNVIFSFCNPFFSDIKATELRDSGRHGEYDKEYHYCKETKFGIRNEYHRPVSYYAELFKKNGFSIIEVIEDKGVEIDTFDTISDSIIFHLKKENCKKILPTQNKQIYNRLIEHELIIYVYSRNSEPKNLFRLFESLQKQTYQNFCLVVVNDNSSKKTSEYIDYNINYSSCLKNKSIIINNKMSLGMSKSYTYCLKNIFKNTKKIIINLNADHSLLNDNILKKIISYFKNNKDMLVATNFNLQNPIEMIPNHLNAKEIELNTNNFSSYLFAYRNNPSVNSKILNTDNISFIRILQGYLQNSKNSFFLKEQLGVYGISIKSKKN